MQCNPSPGILECLTDKEGKIDLHELKLRKRLEDDFQGNVYKLTTKLLVPIRYIILLYLLFRATSLNYPNSRYRK